MFKRKSLLILLACMLIFGVLAGCTSNKDSDSKSTKKASDQILHLSYAEDPPKMDPGRAEDSMSYSLLMNIYEGLINIDENQEIIPGVAEKWEISDDQKTYTFHLREDAKWSNGDPVTAQDFEFAWKRVLDPNLKPEPSNYAAQNYYLKNGEAFHTGKITDASQIGVKSEDDHTLVVELEQPTPYFMTLLTFQTYYPVHKSVKDNENWALEANTMITNGPFKITNWEHNAKIDLVKNGNYWDEKKINFSNVEITINPEANTELSLYEADQLDYAGQPTGDIPTDQIASLKSSKPDEFHAQGIASSYMYIFNVTKKPFNNVNIRKALSLSVDRKSITENVTQGGQIPAFGVVPYGVAGLKDEFRKEVEDTKYFKESVAEAKKYLEEGLKEEGLTEMPEFTLTYNSNSAMHKPVAEAIADMWQKNLGIKVKLEGQDWGVFLETRHSLNYDVARYGWVTDYNDAYSFLELFVTDNGNNDTGYSNPEYDKLLQDSKTETDQTKRNELLKEAEKIIVQDNMVVAPLFYYSNPCLVKPYVKGWYTDYQGYFHYTHAYIEK